MYTHSGFGEELQTEKSRKVREEKLYKYILT